MTTAGLGGPERAPLPDTDAASVIAALHSLAEEIRRAELARAEDRWDGAVPLIAGGSRP